MDPMSVEAIVRVIEAESAEEADRILADARERAAALVRDAEDAADARVRIARERAEPGHRAEAMRMVNAARLRLLERRTEHSAAVVAAVFAEAGARLDAIAADPSDGRWRHASECLIGEVVALAGPGAVIRVRPADAPTARPIADRLGARLDEAVDPAMPPGVLATSRDGLVDVDATLPSRIERARTRFAESVARLLGVG
jgi:V/A-type H+-transporting ATPase subunit E